MITLKPLEPFFFGGEYTFGADESRQETSRYSASSTQFPQQTALLGLLRKTMLIQNGNLTMHRKGEWVDSSGRGAPSRNYDAAKALVGTEAFSYEKTIDLGTIESISPLFINDNGEYYIANAKDDCYEMREQEGTVSLGNGMHSARVFEKIDGKVCNCSSEFISRGQTRKNFSDFFKEVQRIGIKKSQDGKTEEDAYFRKKSYYPIGSATFSFIATFSEEIAWDPQSIVSLGADQSSFKLEAERCDEEYETLFREVHRPKRYSRLVLTSSALLSKEAYEACYFIFGQRQSYRQLVDAKRGKKSKRYYLLEKGSVLYTERLEALEKLLNKKHLQNVGINHYFTIEGK
jgi:CRISPR-associated protein Cmr3